MNILLFGKNGQLGFELNNTLTSLGNIEALDYPEIDISQPESIRPVIGAIQPDVIVNAAAYTAVDKAESEPDLAYALNRDAPAVLAEEALLLHSTLVHFSTDYVFDGTKGIPYREDDVPNPLNTYGKSKLDGERAIETIGGSYLIFRTSCVYSLRKTSFVTNVLQWARESKTLRIVTDQVGNPTWCRSLAEATTQVLAKGKKDIVNWTRERSGLYHLAGDGHASRYDWASEILKNDPQKDEQAAQYIEPALTKEFPAPARRPLFSALDCCRVSDTFDIRLPDWKIALVQAMKN